MEEIQKPIKFKTSNFLYLIDSFTFDQRKGKSISEIEIKKTELFKSKYNIESKIKLEKNYTSKSIIQISSNENENEDDNNTEELINLSNKSNKSNKSLRTLKNISLKEKEERFNKSMELYFIDSKYNIPEHYEEYLIQNLKVINCFQFYLHLPEYNNSFDEIMNKCKDFNLDYDYPYLLIDLDETLIHCEDYNDKNNSNYNFIFNIPLEGNIFQKIGVYIRPHCIEFLKFLNNHFKLILFTAAERDYAYFITENCGLINYFQYILSREYTIHMSHFYIKDLSVFNYKSKFNCLLIDNNIFSFCANLGQAILISSFYGDKEDSELLSIKNYLSDNIIPNTEEMILSNNEFYMYQSLMENIDFDAIV